MNAPHVVEHLLAYVNGNLDDAASRLVQEHLASCDECRREFETMNMLWEELGHLPPEQPAPTLAKSFHQMLHAYEQGREHPRPEHAGLQQKSILGRFWFGRPAFQIGFAGCMIIFGFLCGYAVNAGSRNSQDMTQLHEEVRGLSNLLTMSLLHQESASERLKGVSWGYKLVGGDPDVAAALVYTMKHDRNVNVRLAALDALSRDLSDPLIRSEVIHTLPGQSSPLMQIALVDVLAQINDKESREVLQQSLNRPDLHREVRKRISQGLEQQL